MENYKELAKQKMTRCRVCKECNGIVCAGETPGCGGKGNGSTFIRNVSKLKDVCVNMNVITTNDEVSTEADFFDRRVALPVYIAPIGGIEANYGAQMSEYEYTQALLDGCQDDTVVFSGDGLKLSVLCEPLEAANHRFIVPTIKPWQIDEMKKRFEIIKDKGCRICCCDVDAAGLTGLKKGIPKVEFKSVKDLKEIVRVADMPVIFKGIMSVDAAMKCLEAGASGIVVSNHGGRVLQDGLSTIEVLEEIVLAIHGRMKVFVDGGFRSGSDVFKALALGADGVLIGRPFSIAAIGNGSEGVKAYLNQIQEELKETMMMCGCHKISDIQRNCVKVCRR
ncbi:MAG: alpha-hydroxy-acid oxidizing protein [Traorella sp.]